MKDPCSRWAARITRWLDGELPGGEEAALKEHLTSCRDCRRRVKEQERLRARWSDLATLDSTPEDRAAVMAAAAEDARRDRIRRWLVPGAWGSWVTAAAMLGVVILGFQAWRAYRASSLPAAWVASTPVLSYVEWTARERGDAPPPEAHVELPVPF